MSATLTAMSVATRRHAVSGAAPTDLSWIDQAVEAGRVSIVLPSGGHITVLYCSGYGYGDRTPEALAELKDPEYHLAGRANRYFARWMPTAELAPLIRGSYVQSVAIRARQEQAASGDVRTLLALDGPRHAITRMAEGQPIHPLMTGRVAIPDEVRDEAIAIMRARLARRCDREAVREARRGSPDRIRHLMWQRARERERLAYEARLAAAAAAEAAAAAAEKVYTERLIAGGRPLGRKALALLVTRPSFFETVDGRADSLVRAVVRAVGPIGEQAARDLREMQTDELFAGKRGRNHKREVTTLHRIEHRADWSAALITLRDYRSFGSSRWGEGDRRYGSVGGSSYRCYLVVRDSTDGAAHILRVPPKFGNADTLFFSKFRRPADRIHAAIAWTFGLRPREYRPDAET